MNRRGFFSLLAGIAGAIGVGKVPWAGERRSPVKSPPVLPYDWKQLHAPVTFRSHHLGPGKEQDIAALIEQKMAEARTTMNEIMEGKRRYTAHGDWDDDDW